MFMKKATQIAPKHNLNYDKFIFIVKIFVIKIL